MPDARAVAAAAADRICDAATAAITAHGDFHLVLAGGSSPRDAYRLLGGRAANWKHWHLWYGDERCLPADHPARNSVMARAAWLGRVPVPAAQIAEIEAELGPDAAAARYCRRLAGMGDFDLVLLGLGEDGHTASLFPGLDWGGSSGSPDALPVRQAPKPPAERVSLSAARLSRARAVLFLVTGVGKRDAVAAWQAGRPIPAAAVGAREAVVVLTEPACLPGTSFANAVRGNADG